MFGPRRWERKLAEAETVVEQQRHELTRLRARRAELKRAGEALAATRAAEITKRAGATATTAAATGVRENLLLLAEMSRRDLIKGWQLPFANSQTGEIEPAFFEMMGLSAAERVRVENAWRDARQKIDAGIGAQATLERGGDGSLTFHVGPFAGGEAVYDGLRTTMESILGREGADSFATLFDEQMAKELVQFGLGEWVLKLDPMGTVAPTGLQRYRVSDSRTAFSQPLGSGPGSKSVMATPRNGTLRQSGLRTIGSATMTLPDFSRRHPGLAKLVPGGD